MTKSPEQEAGRAPGHHGGDGADGRARDDNADPEAALQRAPPGQARRTPGIAPGPARCPARGRRAVRRRRAPRRPACRRLSPGSPAATAARPARIGPARRADAAPVVACRHGRSRPACHRSRLRRRRRYRLRPSAIRLARGRPRPGGLGAGGLGSGGLGSCWLGPGRPGRPGRGGQSAGRRVGPRLTAGRAGTYRGRQATPPGTRPAGISPARAARPAVAPRPPGRPPVRLAARPPPGQGRAGASGPRALARVPGEGRDRGRAAWLQARRRTACSGVVHAVVDRSYVLRMLAVAP